MKELGGYFEIEFSNTELGIHPNAVKLNTARNCLEYILLANGYKKVHIPYYTCDAVLEPILKHQIDYSYYHIDENFEPYVLPPLLNNEAFLYTNYFGLKGSYVSRLQENVQHLIIDNAQALFESPVNGADCFYSLRKFVGVPDGAFLYSKCQLQSVYEPAFSSQRVVHLFKRKDLNAFEGYTTFKENELSLSGLPIMSISPSTESFIKGYDFAKSKAVRERNFMFIHSQIGHLNKNKLDVSYISGPLCYPLLTDNSHLKEILIRNKIFVPTYWPNVMQWLPDLGSWENYLVKHLIPLPIDHRYSLDDMKSITRIINQNL